MAEYINRKQIQYTWWQKQDGTFTDGVTLESIINAMPTADVVEVVHGHNATSMHPVGEFLCSVCGFCCVDYTETKYDEDGDYAYSCECEFDYCPKCGAKMDGVSNG